MLVSDRARLDLLLKAETEVRAHHSAVPPSSFYRDKLSSLWRRAAHAPAYADLGAFSPEAFDAVPVITKDELKASPWHFAVGGVDDAAKYYETTGTSGRVTPTPRRVEDVIWNVASVADAWRDLLLPDDRALVLLPSDVVPVGDLIVNVCEYRDVPHTRAYPFSTGITGWDRVIELWRTLRPTAVFVAPGVALQLTRLLQQRGLLAELSGSVRGLLLLGEVSTPALRDRLGRWWGATAYDASYGSTETGTLAATCLSGRLHLLTTTNYFELATDAGIGPIGSGGTGRLVVTPLNLHARPLLRLDTGDEVTIGGHCACGAGTPVVAVHGRSSDAVSVRGVPLTIRAVEDIVYGTGGATGYLVELDGDGRFGRLLLEREVDADRTAEGDARERVQLASQRDLGLRWDDVLFVNALPSTTKSGGSQKSWKRSNIRVVEVAG